MIELLEQLIDLPIITGYLLLHKGLHALYANLPLFLCHRPKETIHTEPFAVSQFPLQATCPLLACDHFPKEIDEIANRLISHYFITTTQGKSKYIQICHPQEKQKQRSIHSSIYKSNETNCPLKDSPKCSYNYKIMDFYTDQVNKQNNNGGGNRPYQNRNQHGSGGQGQNYQSRDQNQNRGGQGRYDQGPPRSQQGGNRGGQQQNQGGSYGNNQQQNNRGHSGGNGGGNYGGNSGGNSNYRQNNRNYEDRNRDNRGNGGNGGNRGYQQDRNQPRNNNDSFQPRSNNYQGQSNNNQNRNNDNNWNQPQQDQYEQQPSQSQYNQNQGNNSLPPHLDDGYRQNDNSRQNRQPRQEQYQQDRQTSNQGAGGNSYQGGGGGGGGGNNRYQGGGGNNRYQGGGGRDQPFNDRQPSNNYQGRVGGGGGGGGGNSYQGARGGGNSYQGGGGSSYQGRSNNQWQDRRQKPRRQVTQQDLLTSLSQKRDVNIQPHKLLRLPQQICVQSQQHYILSTDPQQSDERGELDLVANFRGVQKVAPAPGRPNNLYKVGLEQEDAPEQVKGFKNATGINFNDLQQLGHELTDEMLTNFKRYFA